MAENQDRLQKERTEFVYDQEIRAIHRTGQGKLLAEEDTHWVIAPEETSPSRKLVSRTIKSWQHGHLVETSTLPDEQNMAVDSGLVASLTDDLTVGDSNDGLQQDNRTSSR